MKAAAAAVIAALPGERARRWMLGIGLVAMACIGVLLMLLLAQATNNRELYERYYPRLLAVNIVVAVLLTGIVLWGLTRLVRRIRRGVFGNRLLFKLAAIFALVGVAPGLLIYLVSYQFVSRSIESWFDVKVEGALDAGLNLGRATLDTLAADLAAKSRTAATQLTDVPDASVGLSLERLRDQLEAQDVQLWSLGGQLIASAGQSRMQLSPERPSAGQLRLVRAQRIWTAIEGFDDTNAASNARVRALALVPAGGFGLGAEPRFLQVTRAVPPTLAANALAVQDANREYQQRALARDGLRRMYIGTLTLSLFLAVFTAIVLAVLLGNQLVRPLLLLAEGVRQVAAGDLSPKAALSGQDELGGLTRSFADMTQQLADARADVQHSMTQLDAARGNLQTILDNLTAGVIVLDAQGRIISSNPGATRILREPLAAWEHKPLREVPGLEAFGNAVDERFAEVQSEQVGRAQDHWQDSFELSAGLHGQEQDTVTIVARGAQLPGPDDARLVVFDDISEIVSAQRAQAWGEVARRLAHEIKNPLTPVQLSAERIERRLAAKLDPADQAMLTKAVKTIVDQVEAMKRLVNEFRDFARLPSAQLQPLDINELVTDVLQMYATDDDPVQMQVDLDPDCPPIMGDAQQLRQVLHNLLQNAQDATEGRPERLVAVRSQWVAAAHRVRLVVRDNGAGFPPALLKRAFEPYVTTKAKGTGLGLAVVKKIADEHGARIELSNRTRDGQVAGAQVSLSFNVETPNTSASMPARLSS